MSYKEGFLKFLKFTGKRLFGALYFDRVAGWSPATLVKTNSGQVLFFEAFFKIFRNIFLVKLFPTATARCKCNVIEIIIQNLGKKY